MNFLSLIENKVIKSNIDRNSAVNNILVMGNCFSCNNRTSQGLPRLLRMRTVLNVWPNVRKEESGYVDKKE